MERKEIAERINGVKEIVTSCFSDSHISILKLVDLLMEMESNGATDVSFRADFDSDGFSIDSLHIRPVKIYLESESDATDRIKKDALESEGYAKKREEAQKTEYLRLKTIYENK